MYPDALSSKQKPCNHSLYKQNFQLGFISVIIIIFY